MIRICESVSWLGVQYLIFICIVGYRAAGRVIDLR